MTTRFATFLDPTWRARLEGAALGRAEHLLGAEATLAHLVQHLGELGDPPPESVLGLLEAWRTWEDWRAAVAASGLPDALTAPTRYPRQLAFLTAAVAHPALRDAAVTALEVFDAARSRALDRASVRASPRPDVETLAAHPEGRKALELVGAMPPNDIPTARWLAWRRFAAEGRLTLEVVLPEGLLSDEIKPRFPDPEVAAALEVLLAEHVPAGVRAELDHRAQADAFGEAARAYRGLLAAPALVGKVVVAIYVGGKGQPVGGVRVDGEGALLAHKAFDGKWVEHELGQWLSAARPDAFVLPTSAHDRELLQAVRKVIRRAPAVVKPVALSESRELLRPPEDRLPRELQSALILARRAVAPFEAWSAVDPTRLGLAEYQHDLDEDALRRRLADIRALVAWERQQGLGAPKVGEVAPVGSRLNPLVNAIEDLRPGMTVDAQVVNITSFGAFVTFGLATEGLIHISEISDARVQSVSDVVRIGQRVKARVVEVDVARGRVGLSLRQGEVNRRPQARGKADALAKLDKLFK